jgi:hypothetical protein
MHWKHGAAKKGQLTPEWRAWWAMRSRCTYKNQPGSKNYLERGITVHPEWLRSFEAFLQEVGLRPSPDHTLERKDNDKGYIPGNVVWATRHTQARNQRSNVWVEIDGERKILKDWARELGVSYKRASERIRAGWEPRRALLAPARTTGANS